jgi:NAD(P)-dependent dehydrogenase (short-subunit alcohol dehydrogenase family)
MATQSVLIAGVSKGLGLATARLLAGRGFHVFGSVHNGHDAKRLSADFGSSITPILFDVTDLISVAKGAELVGQILGRATLGGVVNNAAVLTKGNLFEVSNYEFRRQLDVNLIGPFNVTRAFAPLLGIDSARVVRGDAWS